jgi:hypothetical protein
VVDFEQGLKFCSVFEKRKFTMTTATSPRTQAARVFDSHFVVTSTHARSYAASPVTADSWAIQDIKNGIAEADARDFASPEEVRRVFAKYGC